MSNKKISIAYFGSYDPLYTRVRTVLKGLRGNNIEIYECQSKNKWRPLRLFSLAASYLKIAKRVQLLMVSEGGQAYVLLAKILAVLTTKPLLFDAFISYYHVKVIDTEEIKKDSFKGKYYYYLDKWSCQLADLVLLDTEEHIEYFCETFNLSKTKFKSLPAGSDDEIFYPREIERQKNSDFLVFLVASFYPIHGVEYVVRAAKILEKHSDIKFLIVGDGITKPKVENLAREFKSQNVVFRGLVTPNILADLMASADVCLGQFGDTEHAQMVVPAKVYDAAAMAKPIITGGGRAVKSVFTDKENALFCKFADAEDLARKILLLKKNYLLKQKIAQNAHNLFKKRFSLAKTGEILNDIILKVINGEFKPNTIQRAQLLIVNNYIRLQNAVLKILNEILFKPVSAGPKSVLIYKVGNIGDTVCAIPSFIAIRRFYPKAKITLLSSPGKFGAVGAKEFFTGVWYFDDLKIYFSENVDSFAGKKKLIKELKSENYDLFIQLPDDLANLRTLLRNVIFAKLIGVKSAFGFKIRTIQLFKKTQVKYGTQKYEAESLLDLLKENGIALDKIEYDFNILEDQREKVSALLREKWLNLSKESPLIILNPGGKREANRWSPKHFGEIGKYLQEKYNAKIIIIGGREDIPRAEIIQKFLDPKDSFILASQLELLEIIELLKRGSFLISNDTGAIHMAAAVGLPIVGLYCVRNVFNRWFPLDSNSQIIFHKFMNCDYKKEECIKKSIETITVDEVKAACDRVISRL